VRPLLLDLFCGAGGAAVGYHRAGFDVVGVDIKPQPHYPFEFVQADVFEFLDEYDEWSALAVDVIHASPPCQAYTQAQRLHGNEHPDLLPKTRVALRALEFPYIIENVPGAPMVAPFTICGTGLGLGVKRHRWFETNFPVMSPPCGSHFNYVTVFGHSVELRGNKAKVRLKTADGARAMGIDWMNRDELSEAIPPAYTQFIGEQLLEQMKRTA
jgi:DNA (cytosine-5)-methyltransferase 1